MSKHRHNGTRALQRRYVVAPNFFLLPRIFKGEAVDDAEEHLYSPLDRLRIFRSHDTIFTMDLLIIIALFLLLLSGAIVAFRLGGLKWVYIYAAATTGALFVMDFMQVILFGQLLFVSEVFFAANFLITDTIEEHYGKKAARRVIPIVLGTWVFIWLLTYLGTLLSPTDSDPFHGPLSEIIAFYTPMAMGLIVVIYTTLQYIDTYMYDFIRRKSDGRYLWLRNLGSTFTTQTFDVLVSYGILVRVLFPELSWLEIGSAMIAAAVFKYAMAFLDTPFVYLSYKFRPKELLESEKST